MFRTTWKISVRNILKHKVYSSINVIGLALGFSAFILIGLFIRYELGWDKSNENYAQIYRVQRHFTNAIYAVGGNEISPHTRVITASLLEKQFPEFEKITLLQQSNGKFLASMPDRQVLVQTGIFADSCYFDVFSYHFIEGQPQHATSDPFTVVLSETMADKLFAGQSALGKTVSLEKKVDLKVVGVYTDLPENTSIRPDFIGSFSTLESTANVKRNSSLTGDCMTFALLKSGTTPEFVSNKIENVFSVFKDLEFEKLELCPLSKVYLDYNGHGDYILVLMLYGLIGLFILLMSGFNYINLTTANAATRRKEVAIKKVSGSSQTDLFIQFICETIAVSLLALGLAFTIAKLFLPVFSSIVGKPIGLNLTNDWPFVAVTLLISIGVGILSGIYPAFFMSSHKIMSLFKPANLGRGREKFNLKKALVVSQFSISAFLILLTLSFSMQIRYLFQKDLGFKKEGLVYTQMTASKTGITFDQLRSRILSHPEILEASMSRHIPFVSFGGGMTNWEGGNRNDKVVCRFNEVSYDFARNMGIPITAGRDFSRDFRGDVGKSCLINETAAKSFGWDNPIGKRLNDNQLTVVGVTRDFIYKDMHNGIEPSIMVLSPEEIAGTWTFAFRVDQQNQQKAISVLTQEFRASFPSDPFEFHDLPTYFANENTIKVYHAVNRTIIFFTVFNIFLAMIGLLGLVSYTVERRTKEIGVRKINGSTVSNIFYLLSREYFILLFFALLVAFPAAWWIYEKLPSANKLHTQPWIFALGAFIIFLIIILTTSYQTLKAATRNPVEALRYE